ncbi:hypothetical protein H2203_009236 [Taxawa tesnikishii (nom. ined.)]|nr:hypothetical protein H2203_009236 [Dothideales sp. JES 119]
MATSMNVFALGATGYIGGDAFHVIYNAHPDFSYAVLVRDSSRGALVAAQYPRARLVYGSLDDEALIEEEARKASIVCHWANADHAASARAIILTSLPDAAPHREVDKIVLEGGTQHAEKVKTAIICPPTIYGPGRGPGNQRSHQVPELARCTLEKGHGIQVGEGKTFWTSIHVHDLSLLYLSLFRAAVDGHGASRATWGTEGYYFCEAADLRGWIESDEVVKYEPEDANKLTPMGAALWGCNSRARAVRARKLLGWEPRSPSLDAEIGPTVEVEAKRLGLVVGHAKVAAGDLPTSISNPLGTLGK